MRSRRAEIDSGRKLQEVPHFAVLDLMRAVAASSVFVHHVYQQFSTHVVSPILARFLLHLGGWGVAIFFALSGFCIHWSRLANSANGADFQFKEYLLRRFFRIYPALLCCLLVSWLVGNWAQSNLIDRSSLADVSRHLALVSSFSPLHRTSVNSVVWSVVVEAHFYLLYGLFSGSFSTPLKTLKTTCLAATVSAVTYGLSVTIFPQGASRVMLQQTFLATWWTWCLGALAAELIWKRQGRARAARGGYVLLPFSIGLSFAICYLPVAFRAHAERFLLPILAAVVVLLALRLRICIAENSVMSRVGKASYSLYLFHPVAILVGLQWSANTVLSLGIIVLAASSLCAVGYHWIELPGVRLGRSLRHSGDRAVPGP